MRGWLLVPIALGLALAGCLAFDGGEDADVEAQASDERPAIPQAPSPFTHVLCPGDELAELATPEAGGCDRQLTHDSGPAAEVDVAANPTDPSNLIVGSKDFTLEDGPPCDEHNVWSGVYVSDDAGRTWNHSLLPGYPGDDRETALSTYDCGSDPVIAFGPDGAAYYASIHTSMDTSQDDAPRENAGLAVTRSEDGGRTWEDPVVLIHREDGSLLDKEWIAVDPTTGQVYVSYWDTQDGNIEVVRSDDDGETWTEPTVVVAPGDHPGDLVRQFAQVGVAPDGTVHLIYWSTSQDGQGTAVYHRTSTDDGETWSSPTAIATFAPLLDWEITHEYRIVPHPHLAIDGEDGSVHVAFASPATDGVHERPPQHLDVYVVSSTDGGDTWADPVRVNDDLVAPQNERWMSTAEVGPDGTLHVTWLDYRQDPTGQEAYVYYAYSEDEGSSFSENLRVSDVPFDGEGGYHQSGTGTIGDYMGLAATDEAVYPVWADTRYERNDVFAAIVAAR